MSGILVPIFFFICVAAVFIVPRYLKSRERSELQDTVRRAIDKGQPLPPEVLDAMTRDVRPAASPQRDLRTAIVWLAIAIGFAGFGFALNYSNDDVPVGVFLGIAAIPGAIGLAFLALGLLGKKN